MPKWLFSITGVAALCGACYALGRTHAKISIVTEQVEVIKYVEKKTAEIHARPNADRTALLALMHSNRL